MQGICLLDQHAAQIQLTKQLFEHSPLVVLHCGVAGMTVATPRAAE